MELQVLIIDVAALRPIDNELAHLCKIERSRIWPTTCRLRRHGMLMKRAELLRAQVQDHGLSVLEIKQCEQPELPQECFEHLAEDIRLLAWVDRVQDH